ncbi:thioesterase family protein [Thermomonas sp.]|uniref:acyl-CoA thioesterase n=1 Tax=Thermomonas sp. TaxID=1971895 RepID=UPI002BFE5A5A|nr:thioesterase family protein [Thermomonas sp.]HRO62583.1 thioesterase family protein [Thermomonas sp.]
MNATSSVFRMPLPLRWSDLDAFNHVNNARYLTFLEQARIEWFESIGEPWVTEDFAPVVASATLNFKRPIEYPSKVFVELFTDRLSTRSVVIGHRIVDEDGRLYCDGNVVAVWIDRRSGRSTELPECVRRAAGKLLAQP